MIIKLLNFKNYKNNLEKASYLLAIFFQFCHSGTANPSTLEFFIKTLLVEFFLICKLAHTSRCNQ